MTSKVSIYEKVLAEDFTRLHPKLQKRYAFEEPIFKASGTMNRITGGPKWLTPLFLLGAKSKFVFPESGKDIPFTIINTASVSTTGNEEIYWERTFHFPNKTRYFNALMSLDEKQLVVKDYLGEPPLLYSDLRFIVTDNGALKIESLDQRLVLGKIEIPLPKFLQGLATVTETYDELHEVFRITVDVKNPLVGSVFSYEGEFTADA